MKKYLFLIIAFMLTGITAFAQPRSEQEAIQIAQDFFNKKQKRRVPKLSTVSQKSVRKTIRKRVPTTNIINSANCGFYIINDDANDRFVIVSSDERFYKILGYSNNGVFSPEDSPIALLELLDGYNLQYDYLLEHAPNAPKLDQRKANFPTIEPLIKTKWGQHAPYWDWCPYDIASSKTQPCVTGCVATALAQVMKYYEWPEKPAQYTLSYITPFETTLDIKFDTVQFNWDKMRDTYDYYYDETGQQRVPAGTTEERNEVAKLMKVCGISVAMKYGTSRSGAYPQDLVNALIRFFKYNPNILYKQKSDYTPETWDEMILKDLLDGHPILYGGSKQGGGGHQFILDGCDNNGMYHFNFGWNGRTDGYYTLTGTEAIDYDSGQDMVYQITPEEYGIHEDFYATDFIFKKRTITIGDKLVFSLDVEYAREGIRVDNFPFSGQVGLALYDKNFNFIQPLFAKETTIDGKGYYSYMPYNGIITLDESIFTNGSEFIIAPFSKDNNAVKPSLIRNKNGQQNYYLAKVENGNIKICPQGVEIAEVAGYYRISAEDALGKVQEWYAYIYPRYKDSDYYYRIKNIVPNPTNGNGNLVSATAQLSSDGQELTLDKTIYGADGFLANYTYPEEKIVLNVDSEFGSLTLKDSWGVMAKDDNTELSRYSNVKIEPVSSELFNITITDNKAGELDNRLDIDKKLLMSSLTIIGNVNGSDIKLIRSLLQSASLTQLDLHDAVINEGGEPYYNNCITENNVLGDSIFYDCDKLKSIRLPSKLSNIGKYAFLNCENLDSVVIPEGINRMSDYLFLGCKALSYISIPSTVNLIANTSLSSCSSLKRIDCYIRDMEKVRSSDYSYPWAYKINAFNDIRKDCEWHVSEGLKQRFMDQIWWKDSWTIIDDLPSTVMKGDCNEDGEVDVTDVTSIINYIMLQPQEIFNFDASDVNDDGEVDVTDLTLIINLIMAPEKASARRAARRIANTGTVTWEMEREEEGFIIKIASPENYISAQFDVTVPSGKTIEGITLGNCNDNDHNILIHETSENQYRIIVFSMSNTPFEVGLSDWLHIKINDGAPLEISNAVLTTTSFAKQYANAINAYASSIKVLKANTSTSSISLDGRQLKDGTKLSKGIYIINGEKIVVK